MENKPLITVEVCYLAPEFRFQRTLRVPEGDTIRAALEVSGLFQALPELNLEQLKVGIFSKFRPLDTVLQERDRIEVYRPLLVDPMAARRARAGKKRT